MWTIRFHGGTLVVEGAHLSDLPDGFQHDDRISAPRGPAWRYPDVVLKARRDDRPYTDDARQWAALSDLAHTANRTPRDYQQQAVDQWIHNGRRGVVILPTGTGKSFVAEMAIASTKRPTLVLAPTLDLVGQWHARLDAVFSGPVGLMGGGHHEIERITVSTYDSANLHLHRYGDRFGLIIFDEVHHLPAPAYLAAAESAMAPFRLGLTATFEREDARETLLDGPVGPVVFRREITELSGEYLAKYEVIRLSVKLSDEEAAAYQAARQTYRDFIRSNSISMRGPYGWQQFLKAAARSKAGRAAFKAYLTYKRIAHGTERKLDLLSTILDEEAGRRTIIFTHDNATAYRVSREFLVPCITHQTDLKERKQYLADFGTGDLPTLVTSRVLNEGVDLPAAEVGIVLSGTGTVREHVQRLGRILRPMEGKQATLYELVTQDTTEEFTSERRRRHDAF
ncbi:MAG: DEAD/DEAH box helicase family protein [Myxococcota bacterium]